MTTKIEWTDEVWNPVTGCTKVSAGCKNCYAERLAERFWGDRKFTDVICHGDRLEIPFHWRKPRLIFVNSMSDLFHPAISYLFIEDVWRVMANTSRHTYQILTKRPERMSKDVEYLKRNRFNVLPNVWLGVSVENQTTADERIPWLLKTPAAVRFVSYEPALGALDSFPPLHRIINAGYCGGCETCGDIVEEEVTGLDWVIAGGESGPGARPAHPDWFRSVRDQCQTAGVPFFFKQWGEWLPDSQIHHDNTDHWPGFASARFGALAPDGDWTPDLYTSSLGECMYRLGKRHSGRLLDGREWNEYPEVQS